MQRSLLLSLVVLPSLTLFQEVHVPATPWNKGPVSPCLSFAPGNTIEWPPDPGFGTPAGFQRLVLADLDGDQDPEAVVLADGIPVVLWKVALYDAPERIRFPSKPDPSDVHGIAVIPGSGPGEGDALALTDERGLYLVRYLEGAFQDPQALGEQAWIDAAPLRADDLDGDQDLDLFAIAADGHTIRTMLRTGAGFVPGITIEEPLPVKEVVAVNWDSLPGRELVVLSKRGLLIHDSQGNQIGSVTHLSNTGCLTCFRAADVEGGELLAWTRASPAGTSELVVLNQTISEGPWPLGFDFCSGFASITPIALLRGNYDGDGNDELLLVHAHNKTAILLRNLGAGEVPPIGPPGPHFDPEDEFSYDIVPLSPTTGAPGGGGVPAFGQIDGVDSDDIAFPVATTGKVEVFLQLPFQRALDFIGGGINSADVVSDHTEFGSDAHGDKHLRLGFLVPNRYSDSTHVDLTVWRQPSAPMSPVEHHAVYHARHPLLVASGMVDPAQQWIDVELAFPAFGAEGECWSLPKNNYYTEYRFVRVSSGGQEKKSSLYTGGLTLETCGAPMTDYYDLITQGIPGTKFFLYEHNGLTSGSEDARNVLGLYVPMSSQPPFDDVDGNPDPGVRGNGALAHPFQDQ